MSLPEQMQALVFHTAGDQSVRSIPLPKLRPSYLLIKVETIALNPTDWKHVTYATGASPYSIIGCDYAGTVIAVGDEVTKSFKVGDKIYGCAHGGNFNEGYDGVFAEYAMVKGDVAMHVPATTSGGGHLSMEDLCTVGLGSVTVGQGLFQSGKGFGLTMPNEHSESGGDSKGEWLLIYGGSTATGTLGIQFAKLAGYRVVTTCSPRNFELVRSRGADAVFDYHDAEAGSKIHALTENKLRYAWDTIDQDTSGKICNAALSTDDTAPPHYGSILGDSFEDVDATKIKCSFSLMYTVFGEAFDKYGEHWPVSEADFEFAKRWMALTEGLVGSGKVRPHPKSVREGGLEGVIKGIEDLKEGRVTGEKLVFRI